MFLCVGILVACQPRERVIDYPAFQAKNSASLEISRIVLNDSATIIYGGSDIFYALCRKISDLFFCLYSAWRLV